MLADEMRVAPNPSAVVSTYMNDLGWSATVNLDGYFSHNRLKTLKALGEGGVHLRLSMIGDNASGVADELYLWTANLTPLGHLATYPIQRIVRRRAQCSNEYPRKHSSGHSLTSLERL
jgi:hypothetical protein